MKKRFLFPLVIIGMALASCSKGDLSLKIDKVDLDFDAPWTEYSLPITSVSFEEGQDSVTVHKGEKYEYQYSIEPKKAMKKSLSWSSSDEEVATVERGVVTAVGAGKAEITVFNKEYSFAPIALNVEVDVPVKDISFSSSTFEANINSTYQLEAVFSPADTTETALTWASENESVATIDSETGLLTTYEVEEPVVITARSAFINKTISMTVNVADRTVYPTSVIIDECESSIEVGKQFTMSAHAASEQGEVTYPTITYHSENDNIVTVESETGVVHAISAGSTRVYAEAHNGVKGYADVEVFEVKVASLILSDITLDNRNGRTDIQVPLEYTVDKEGYIEPSIPVWSYEVADPTIATVTSQGKLFAVADNGTTTLTVREARSGLSKTVNLSVGYVADTVVISGASTVTIGDELQLGVTTSPSGVPASMFTFSSSDDDIATVDANGVVRGVSAGKVTITVGALTAHSTIEITVKDPEPQHQYYVEGIGGDWSVKEQYAMSPDASDPNHYYLGPVYLTANTKVKVYDYRNDKWYGSTQDYSEQAGYWKADSEGNILVKISGDYYIDLLIEHGEGNHVKLWYSGTEDDPVFGHEYYACGIGGDWNAVEQYGLKQDSDPEKAGHYYLGPLTLPANTEIKIYQVTTDAWFGSTAGYTKQEGKWTTVEGGNVKTLVSGSFYIDFYVNGIDGNADNHLALWYDGEPGPGPEPVETTYHLWGDFNTWSDNDSYLFTATEDSNKFTLENVTIQAGQAMKGHDSNGTYYGVGEAYPDCGWTVGENGNCVVTEGGIYTVDLYLVDDYGHDNHIVITKTGDIPGPGPEPGETTYHLWGDFNSWADDASYLFTATEESGKFTLENVTIQALQEMQVHDSNGNYYGVGEAYPDCGWTVGDNGNCVVTEGGVYTVDFYLVDIYGHDNHIVITKTGDIPGPGPGPVETTYHLWGDFNSWADDANYLFTATEDSNKFTLENVTIQAGQEMQVHDSNGNYYGVNLAYPDCGWSVGNNHNCVVTNGGIYTVDFYIVDEYETDNHIVITKTGDIPGPGPEPVLSDYYLKGDFNDWGDLEAYRFAATSDSNKFTLENVTITKGQAMKGFKADNNWYGVESYYANCLYTVGDGGNCVALVSGVYTVNLYVNSESNNHIELIKTGDLEGYFTATVNVDLNYFSGWEPGPYDYSLYVWDASDAHALGEYDYCKGNLNEGTVQITSNTTVTHFIFYFYQNGVKKYSVNLTCTIDSAGTYTLNLSGMGGWSGDSFSGVTITKNI